MHLAELKDSSPQAILNPLGVQYPIHQADLFEKFKDESPIVARPGFAAQSLLHQVVYHIVQEIVEGKIKEQGLKRGGPISLGLHVAASNAPSRSALHQRRHSDP